MKLTGPIDWNNLFMPPADKFYRGLIILTVCDKCGALLAFTAWKFRHLGTDYSKCYCDECKEIKHREWFKENGEPR